MLNKFCFTSACMAAVIAAPSANLYATTNTAHLASIDPQSTESMVLIPGGTLNMGTEDGFPFEGPAHEVTLKPYYIDRTEVTVAQFQKFVEATGYKTESEKLGWSGVFDTTTGEWTKGDGATWLHPEGPGTTATLSEPVTHVSYADAVAYAKWADKRLPTEAEWEYASRGGLKDQKFAWGDKLLPDDTPIANWWQGHFPDINTKEDGYLRRAPVAQYPPNGYGLYDITGNVWEWTSDWYSPTYYSESPKENPQGPSTGSERSIRGGGWMCSINFCQGFRVAARNNTAPIAG